jgi:hypothetical protein
LPKLYARLRRADRRAYWTGNWKASRKYREAIHHVEQAVCNFVERELLALLSASRRFAGRELSIGRLKAGAGSVRFELQSAEHVAPLAIALEEQSGWLVARVIEPGWSAALEVGAQQALADALTGFYKISGVDLIREQIESALDSNAHFEIDEHGLSVCSAPGAAPVRYDLREQSETARSSPRAPSFAGIDLEQLAFFASPVTWELWVEVWDRDQSGGRHPPRLVIGANLLSAGSPRAAVQPT